MAGEVVKVHISPRPGRHVEGVDDQSGCHRSSWLPVDEAPGVIVDGEGDIDDALPRRAVVEARHPQLVRPVGGEVTVDEVGASTEVESAFVVKRFFTLIAPQTPAWCMVRADRGQDRFA